jgi:hypothetical protein
LRNESCYSTTSHTISQTTLDSFGRLKNIYHPIIARVYHAHALRIYLLRGRIPIQIKSIYTTPWYDDMLPLPVHPLRSHRNLIDRVLNPSTPHQAQPKHYEDVDTNATGPLSRTPRTKSVPDHESYPSQPMVPLHRTRETS